MATITSTPTASSITVNGNTQVSGTISWSKPTIPSGATISSCVLTGTATASMSKGSATITVNGTTVTSGSTFTVNLGTSNNTTSVTTTAKGGNKNASGTVSFSNLVYTVTYSLSYTVTFVDWNGTVLKTQTVEEGSSATAPSNPIRDGYLFTGWDISFNNVTSNLTVTAQYAEVQYYTVTFIDWNGTVLKTEQVEQGTSATAPANPTREGYKFTGWDASFNNVTNNLTVTAQYVEAVYYTVTFVDWDGTVLKTQTVEEKTSATAPINPIRDGYLFTGWDVSFNNVTSNLTVTAQYILDTTFSGVGTVIENISGRNPINLEFNMDWSTQELEIDGHFEIPDCVIGTKYTLFNMTFNNSGILQSYRLYFIKESTTNTYLEFTVTSSGSGTNRGSVTVTEIDGIISGDYKVIINTPNDYMKVTIYHNDVAIAGSLIYDVPINTNILTIGDTDSYGIVDGSTLNSIKIVRKKELTLNWDQQLGTVLERLDSTEWKEWDIYVSFNDTQYLEYDLTFNMEVNPPLDRNYLINLNAEELITHENIWLLREVSANQFVITFYNPNIGLPDPDDINIGPITRTDSTITLKIKEYCDRDEIYYNGEFLQEAEIGYYDQMPRTSWFSKNSPSYPWREDAVITNMQVKQIGAEPEEPDLIEPVDGYIAKNLVSYGDWSYTFNVDWDTQYLDIEVLNYKYGVFRADYYYIISNNSYDADYSHESMDNFTIHGVEVESRPEDIDIIRYSKVDGVCIITSNGTQIIPGNAFANDNKTTIEAVIPTEWMAPEDGYMTFNIKITDITPSEEPEEDNNELIQGDINDETGTFEDEVPNVVKTRYIDISNKKQILVNVLTEDVYVLKCYLYNANKELVKVIDISADKKRMFGLDLQKIIDEVINNGNE